jgi:hypothetical protein
MRSRVDYRFLRAVINPITGDEVTIGVLHWDGHRLRFASAPRSVPQDLKGEVKRVLRSIRERVTQIPPGRTDLLGLDIAALFPVPEGRGSLIHWGNPVSGLSSSSEQHFAQLVEAAGFQTSAKDTHVSKNTLRTWINGAAHQLQNLAPERVTLDSPSPGHIPFDAPIAWKNGVWNFALPWSFDSHKELEEQVRSLVGQLTTGLDHQARGAVIFFAPADTRARVLQELSYVEGLVAGTRTSELRLRDGKPDTADLETMIRTDVLGA